MKNKRHRQTNASTVRPLRAVTVSELARVSGGKAGPADTSVDSVVDDLQGIVVLC